MLLVATCRLVEDCTSTVEVSSTGELDGTALLVVSDGDGVTDPVVNVDPDSCGTSRLLDVWLWLVAGGMEDLDDKPPILDEAMLVKDCISGVGTEFERA